MPPHRRRPNPSAGHTPPVRRPRVAGLRNRPGQQESPAEQTTEQPVVEPEVAEESSRETERETESVSGVLDGVLDGVLGKAPTSAEEPDEDDVAALRA
ncbi:MAG: hypothetical protein M3422_23725, partial [Actinomycetota bacterium]|nr:hypothetical protein [Actinomycetota bacterium]